MISYKRKAIKEHRISPEKNSPEAEVTREGALQTFMELRAQAKDNGISDMSLDDINREIILTRKESDE